MYFSLYAPDGGSIVSSSNCKEYLLNYFLDHYRCGGIRPGKYTLGASSANPINVTTFLHLWEAALPVEPCETTDDRGVVKIKFDSFWLQSPALLSAFALFVRIADTFCRSEASSLPEFLNRFPPISADEYNNMRWGYMFSKDVSTKDGLILQFARPRFDRLANGDWKFLCNPWKDDNEIGIHGQGIARGVLP